MSLLDKKLLPKTLFISKKKKVENQIKATGINIIEPPFIDKNSRIFFILVNALINFLVVIGTVGCFMGAFDMSYNAQIIWLMAIIISMGMAFFYYNTFIKILGYILSLVIFLYGIFQYRYLIKGGFGYICNHMMEFFEKELDLPVERSYDVYGYSEKIAVTVCLIFIIFSIMLMFNMAISESKGMAVIFLFTFPVVQMGMYFDTKISIPYFILYMIGIISLAFFRNSRHYRIEYKKRRGYKPRYRKSKVIYDYTNDGKYSICFLLTLAIIVVALSLAVGVIYPQKKYDAKDEYSQLKSDTMDFTKRLILVGFWGMLSPNGGSAGGVGRSRMGQSKYVTLDYETDLFVIMPVGKKEDTVYLKNFNGTFYEDAYWKTISEQTDNRIHEEDYGVNAKNAMELNGKMADVYRDRLENRFIGRKNIRIVNVAANPNYAYIPYNTSRLISDWNMAVNDDELQATLEKEWYLTLTYSPFSNVESVDEFRNDIETEHKEIYNIAQKNDDKEIIKLFDMEEAYSEYVHDMYLDVPKENIEAIADFCKEYGLSGDSDDIVERLAEIFEENYEYTLMPGVTPSKKEFVNYFLEENKKGYCVYFATASTLIFRYLGIPARYAGGYVIQPGDFASGTDTTEEYSEWEWILENEEQYFKGVYEYEVNDSQAHAWVEIYIDGFGWLPVDTTPPSDEDEENEEPPSNNAFMNFMTNTILTRETFNAVRDTTFGIVYSIVLIGSVVICIYIIVGICVRKKRKNSDSVLMQYNLLCKGSKMLKIVKDENETYESYGNKLIEVGITTAEIMKQINYIIEKEKFSGRSVSGDASAFVKHNVDDMLQEIYSRLNIFKKFIFKYIKWL